MKTPSVSLLLGVSVLLLSGLTVSAVSLNVSPNRLQFFKEESVSLRCEGQVVSDGQTVKRTRGGQTEDCGPASGFGRFDGSSCIISGLSVSDSGGYWCEDRADQINISVINTVTDKAGVPVILEIPALPVMTGSDVTLRCRDKDNNRFKTFFFRDGKDLGSGPDGELPLSKVQQSHEGLYWCYRNKGVDSPQSRLRVRAPPSSPLPPPPRPPPTTSPPKPDLHPSPPPPPSSPLSFPVGPSSNSSTDSHKSSNPSLPPFESSSFLRSLPVHVIAALGSLVLLVLLVLVLGGLLQQWRKQTGSRHPPPPVDVTYADVSIRPTVSRRDRCSSDEDTVYSAVRTHTAGTDEVIYGQVIIRGQRTADRRTEQPSDPDVVYSSVRAVI
ncbi:uncharacterized protein LOC108874226 isoform X3 [Lates calcarifer]|uniref:Uncharacterized protein LOC108874226 isoform X3 n=1 Tax=Lates calcarifer TaxID=8187 RepID=A0AAJ8B2H5_LATCA|nr:uncharacterized protein LOC108874226 isoform X3 [Lates calcarifer]